MARIRDGITGDIVADDGQNRHEDEARRRAEAEAAAACDQIAAGDFEDITDDED